MTKLTTAQAAAYLGTTPQLIRMKMDAGEWAFGAVIRGEKRNMYLIYKELIDKAAQEGRL